MGIVRLLCRRAKQGRRRTSRQLLLFLFFYSIILDRFISLNIKRGWFRIYSRYIHNFPVKVTKVNNSVHPLAAFLSHFAGNEDIVIVLYWNRRLYSCWSLILLGILVMVFIPGLSLNKSKDIICTVLIKFHLTLQVVIGFCLIYISSLNLWLSSMYVLFASFKVALHFFDKCLCQTNFNISRRSSIFKNQVDRKFKLKFSPILDFIIYDFIFWLPRMKFIIYYGIPVFQYSSVVELFFAGLKKNAFWIVWIAPNWNFSNGYANYSFRWNNFFFQCFPD